MSVLAYRELGYLPQALLNALARIGWSYGDQEKFNTAELIEKFSLENVGRSAGIFNMDKLLDLNAQYIRETPTEALAPRLMPFLEREGVRDPDHARLPGAVETLKARSKTLADMARQARFYFMEEVTYDPAAADKFLTPHVLSMMKDLHRRIQDIQDFTRENTEKIFLDFIEKRQVKLGTIAQPLRVALTGAGVSPGLFEVMEVLGREEVLKRIKKAIAYINHEGGSANTKSSSS